jgi:NAD(P)-dependent dehydrogenase (short-subunit alcohol dehydrogenase family)
VANDREASIRGKIVVITGATSGIGRIAAEKLARMGARLVLIARDRARAEDTLARLRELNPAAVHGAHYADLCRIAEVKRVAAEIAAAEPRIDVLVNNAGAIFAKREITPEGIERTFAINHMAYFVLTHCLRDRLIAAAPARIVCTASDKHRGHRLDFANLQLEKGYGAQKAYSRSKLANILFTRELARRLAGTGVTVNCLHPGFVATRLGNENTGIFGLAIRVVMRLGGPPERGADTIVHLSSAPELAEFTGGYFYDCRLATPSPEAQDAEAAKRLWDESARIAGVE